MKNIFLTSTAAAMLVGFISSTYAAGYAVSVQSLNVPGAATRMSGNGAIVGNYVSKCTTFTYGVHEKGTYCYYAPWFYNGNKVTKLGTQWSNARSTAVDINDSLQLTGSDGSGPWIYSGGTITRMTGGTPVALNNTGVAVGNAPSSSFVYKAVRFTDGLGIEVRFDNPANDPALAGYLNAPTTTTPSVDINDNGLISGWYKDAANIQQSYVVDPAGKATVIPNLGGATPVNCQPNRISEANPSSGEIWVAGNCSGRAFIYELTSGTLTELANLPGASNLNVSSVNSSGEAVGTALTGGGIPTVLMWPANATSGTIPTDINANQAIASGSMINLRAIDMDENGMILLDYLDSQYSRNTLLVQAVPVP